MIEPRANILGGYGELSSNTVRRQIRQIFDRVQEPIAEQAWRIPATGRVVVGHDLAQDPTRISDDLIDKSCH
jgi:hypothetical protein